MPEREPLNIVEVAAITGVLLVLELFLAVLIGALGLGSRLQYAAQSSFVAIVPTGIVVAVLMRHLGLDYRAMLLGATTSLQPFVILLALYDLWEETIKKDK